MYTTQKLTAESTVLPKGVFVIRLINIVVYCAPISFAFITRHSSYSPPIPSIFSLFSPETSSLPSVVSVSVPQITAFVFSRSCLLLLFSLTFAILALSLQCQVPLRILTLATQPLCKFLLSILPFSLCRLDTEKVLQLYLHVVSPLNTLLIISTCKYLKA